MRKGLEPLPTHGTTAVHGLAQGPEPGVVGKILGELLQVILRRIRVAQRASGFGTSIDCEPQSAVHMGVIYPSEPH